MFSPDGRLAHILGSIFDIVVIGIIWFVTSLPLITAGAAATSAYYTMSKVVRHKTGYMLGEYFRSFKLNFKQSLIPSVAFILFIVAMVLDVIYVWTNRGQVNDALFIVLMGVGFIFLAIVIYFPPFLSRFDKKNIELIKMAAYAAFRYLPITIGCTVLLAAILIGIWFMPWSIVVFPGIYLYVITYPMEYVMKKFMQKPEEGSPEADMWYFN